MDHIQFSSEEIPDDFNIVSTDEGLTYQIFLKNGKLYEQTWMDTEEVQYFKNEAELARREEGLAGEGAFAVHACELPATILKWIIDRYELAGHLNTKEAKRKIFWSVENDTIITPIGEENIPLKIFKYTNKRIDK